MKTDVIMNYLKPNSTKLKICYQKNTNMQQFQNEYTHYT